MKPAYLIIVALVAAVVASGCKKSADIGETVQGPKHVGANGPNLGPGANTQKPPSQP